MDPSTPISFLSLSLSHAFSLSLHHSTSLLSQPTQHFSKILCKGLQGSFLPVQTWYREMYSRGRELAGLLEKQGTGITDVMRALSGGLDSEDGEVRYWTCRTLGKLSREIGEKGSGEIRQWAEREILKDLVYRCYYDPMLLDSILDLLICIWPFPHFPQLFNVLIPINLPTSCTLVQFLSCTASLLIENQSLTTDLQNSGLLDHWLDLSLKSAQFPSNSTQLSAYFLLSRLWIIYTYIGKSEVCGRILALFGQGMNDRVETLRVICAGMAMEVLEMLGMQGKGIEVLKLVLVKVVEEEIGSMMGDFYMCNLALVLRKVQGFPLSPLLSLLLPKVFCS